MSWDTMVGSPLRFKVEPPAINATAGPEAFATDERRANERILIQLDAMIDAVKSFDLMLNRKHS